MITHSKQKPRVILGENTRHPMELECLSAILTIEYPEIGPFPLPPTIVRKPINITLTLQLPADYCRRYKFLRKVKNVTGRSWVSIAMPSGDLLRLYHMELTDVGHIPINTPDDFAFFEKYGYAVPSRMSIYTPWFTVATLKAQPRYLTKHNKKPLYEIFPEQGGQ